MESPPYSTHSEAPPLSEDSGLIVTSGSFSSDSASGWHHVSSELQESDFDDRSLSPCESTETSERMCEDFFNTVKKGPGKAILAAIEPPPEFQDVPDSYLNNESKGVCLPASPVLIDKFVENSQSSILNVPPTKGNVSPLYPRKLRVESLYERRQCRFSSPGLLHLSPCRANRPSSRSSLSSRLSSSHNSLVTQFQVDDSTFITQAISHDTLSAKTSDITDMYNVPFDSDIYAVPIDMVQPGCSSSEIEKCIKRARNKNRDKNSSKTLHITCFPADGNFIPGELRRRYDRSRLHHLPSSSCKNPPDDSDTGPIPFTLHDVRRYLHTIYARPDTEYHPFSRRTNAVINAVTNANRNARLVNKESQSITYFKENNEMSASIETNNNNKKPTKNTLGAKSKKKNKDNVTKDVLEIDKNDKVSKKSLNQGEKSKMSPVRLLSNNLKKSLCNLFRWRRQPTVEISAEGDVEKMRGGKGQSSAPTTVQRALPPLPPTAETSGGPDDASTQQSPPQNTLRDFAKSLQKVKDCGWYWGPLSAEAAEKILSNEPDGSFIVRDSSDDHYIFTLSFKLNGLRHVRIEHDQGNFCFSGCTMFRAHTIMEFIDNAVETSRSGRYLFFLNLRPIVGPVRVQLLYPVSRFKRVQSLQHMCRFEILKRVRRDLIGKLPLPERMIDYLSVTDYYSELLADL